MIASGYTIDLYCDARPDDPRHSERSERPMHGGFQGDGAAQFFDEVPAVAWATARREGWWVDRKTGDAICPGCVKEGKLEERVRFVALRVAAERAVGWQRPAPEAGAVPVKLWRKVLRALEGEGLLADHPECPSPGIIYIATPAGRAVLAAAGGPS